jgi:hypothetical protein
MRAKDDAISHAAAATIATWCTALGVLIKG